MMQEVLENWQDEADEDENSVAEHPTAEDIAAQVTTHQFNCLNCTKEVVSKNLHAKYCCEYCRVEGIRRKRKSDFYTKKDDFDDNGIIEWANPEFMG